MPAAISLIVPTLAESGRGALIWEAVDSILSQPRVAAAPIVVINGTKYDPALRRQLETCKHLTTHYQELGSLPRAISAGRRLVRTDFFAFLDDDDRLLPDTLAERVELLSSDTTLDAIVSNGFRYVKTDSGLLFPTPECLRRISGDPLRALFAQNWLASCGGTFRTDSIPADFFDDTTAYLEWTDVAFRLALTKRFKLEPGIRFFVSDQPNSQSKLGADILAELMLWDRIRPRVAQRRDLTLLVKTRVSRSHHLASAHFHNLRQTGEAWRHHVRSITSCPTYGWRFLPYTRHLLSRA
jgi:glycosyltransferase involved in cell wall biosynthesis